MSRAVDTAIRAGAFDDGIQFGRIAERIEYALAHYNPDENDFYRGLVEAGKYAVASFPSDMADYGTYRKMLKEMKRNLKLLEARLPKP